MMIDTFPWSKFGKSHVPNEWDDDCLHPDVLGIHWLPSNRKGLFLEIQEVRFCLNLEETFFVERKKAIKVVVFGVFQCIQISSAQIFNCCPKTQM